MNTKQKLVFILNIYSLIQILTHSSDTRVTTHSSNLFRFELFIQNPVLSQIVF
jgi:hypothetical protein